MCSNWLVLREDPSTFEVLNLCKYFQHFIKYLQGFGTSKGDGSYLNTKQLEHIVVGYLQITKAPSWLRQHYLELLGRHWYQQITLEPVLGSLLNTGSVDVH